MMLAVMQPTWRRSGVLLATLLAVIAVSAAVGRGYGLPVVGMLVLAGALVVGMANWRWSVYGLLAYFPVSGVPSILSYPDTRLAVLLKDFLFVIPAYAGYFLLRRARRTGGRVSFVIVFLFVELGTWVVAQIFNPALPNRFVGLIGAKVWLLYLPLYLLGYSLVSSKTSLRRLLGFMSVIALVPCVIGIIEAVLLYAGYQDMVYGAYGPAAAAVTQGFAQFGYEGGGRLLRVPSTFSYATQYYTFTAAMAATAYAWWRSGGGLKSCLTWATVLVAGFLTGARGAFVFIPLLVLMQIVLDGRSAQSWIGAGVLVGALALVMAVLGTNVGSVLSQSLDTGRSEFDQTFISELQQAVSASGLGLGAGVDTNAARYALPDPESGLLAGRTWYESWVVKTVLELGLPGLVMVGAIIVWILGVGLRNHVLLKDPALRSASAALLSVLIWNVAYFPKAQYVDLDPMNVYFWLFAGILARIPTLASAPSPSSRSQAGQPVRRDHNSQQQRAGPALGAGDLKPRAG